MSDPYPPSNSARSYPAAAESAARDRTIRLIARPSMLAMAAGIFLPFISHRSESFSLFDGMLIIVANMDALPPTSWVFWAIPTLIMLIVLMALSGWRTLTSPSKRWVSVTQVLGPLVPLAVLIMFYITRGFALGSRDTGLGIGVGLVLIVAGDILLYVICMRDLTRRRRGRAGVQRD